MRPDRRGSALIVALLLCLVVLTMGIAIVYTQSRGYSGSRAQTASAQARLLAEAGIQDVTMKLAKDPRFPPTMGGRKVFAFSQALYDPEDSTRCIGFYNVTMDVTNRLAPSSVNLRNQSAYDHPNFTIRIRSDGVVTDAVGNRRAQRTIDAELDMSPKARGVPVTGSDRTSNDPAQYYTNPNYFRFLRWEDSGGL